jgi:hypothetical protein
MHCILAEREYYNTTFTPSFVKYFAISDFVNLTCMILKFSPHISLMPTLHAYYLPLYNPSELQTKTYMHI